MVTGGEPAKARNVLTWSRDGKVIAAFVLAGGAAGGYMCCLPPGPPNPPPQPDPVVDAAWPPPEPVIDDAAADQVAEPDPPAKCEFVGPRARGGKRRDPRIVGGTQAQVGAFPFAAAIETAGGFQYCGGSVIAGRFVLTAAHCQVEAGDRVVVGSVDLRLARRVAIVESRIHKLFSSDTLDYDVAIAVLASDAGVPDVPVATGITTNFATVIGWGKTCENCQGTRLLQEVTIPLVDHAQCSAELGGLTHRQVCAGLEQGGKDSCQGDSGGSLLTMNVGQWEQLGIVSWGIGCARPNAPGVYTDLRAPEIRSWITACAR